MNHNLPIHADVCAECALPVPAGHLDDMYLCLGCASYDMARRHATIRAKHAAAILDIERRHLAGKNAIEARRLAAEAAIMANFDAQIAALLPPRDAQRNDI